MIEDVMFVGLGVVLGLITEYFREKKRDDAAAEEKRNLSNFLVYDLSKEGLIKYPETMTNQP